MTTTQAALLEALIEEAFFDGYTSHSTYNDVAVTDINEEWAKARSGYQIRIAAIAQADAALRAAEAAQPEPVARRSALEDECARTDSLLTILGLSAEQCRTEGGSLQPRKVLELLADARAKATPAPLHEVMRHVRRLMAHVDSWTRWYGQADVLLHHQLPLPPAGTVHILEDLEEAIRNAAPPQPAPIAAQAGPLGDSVVCPWCLEGFTVLAPVAAQAGPAQAPLTADQESRAMFVARLENMQEQGDKWLTVPAVLALLNDCDFLASRSDQAPASTRPADASISGQRVDMTGWKWVPVELTVDMESAAYDTRVSLSHNDVCAIWSAVLAAAPQAPAEQPADVFSLMLHSRPRHEDAPENALVDMPPPVLTESEQDAAVKRALARASTPVAPAEPAAQAVAVERERWTTLLTEKWHAGEGKGQTLAQYMGMSNEEYAAWVTQTTPAAREALPMHEVWREGYRITGESECAFKLGEAQAATFEEACDIVCSGKADYDANRLTVWGCRLFNNEADARRFAG